MSTIAQQEKVTRDILPAATKLGASSMAVNLDALYNCTPAMQAMYRQYAIVCQVWIDRKVRCLGAQDRHWTRKFILSYGCSSSQLRNLPIRDWTAEFLFALWSWFLGDSKITCIFDQVVLDGVVGDRMKITAPGIVVEVHHLVDLNGDHFGVWIFGVAEDDVCAVDDISVGVVVKDNLYDTLSTLKKVESGLNKVGGTPGWVAS